jgi:hypothetical protein
LDHVIAEVLRMRAYPEERGGRPADVLIDGGEQRWMRALYPATSSVALYTPVSFEGDTVYKLLPADAIEDTWGPLRGLHFFLPSDRSGYPHPFSCLKCNAPGYANPECLFCHIHWPEHPFANCLLCGDALSHSPAQP